MKKFYIYILISITFFSCKNAENSININLNDFQKTINLKSNKIEKINQLTPSSICVFDSIIMITDYTENPRFHFYNKKTLNKIGQYGLIGKGPEEFDEPECNCQTFKKSNSKDEFIMIYEFGYGLIHEVNLSSILRNEKSSKINKFYLNPEIYNADNVYFINDSVFGEATDNKNVKYFKSSLKNPKSFNKLGVVNNNEFLSKLPIEDKVNLDRSYMAFSKDNNKFIAAYLRYNKIKILDTQLNEKFTILYGESENEIKKFNLSSPQNIFYFKRPFAGKQYFYVPYIGEKNEVSTTPKEIHVFDYNGNPVNRYILDTPIRFFTVDEKQKKLYVITGQDDKPYVEYKL